MKRILSIDGGGIRGLIPALVLAEIEEKTGRATAENFDLIAGTSTGGILAVGLSKDGGAGKPAFSAKALAGLYEKRGKDIFKRSLWKGVCSIGGIADELYPCEGIEKVLKEYFGDATLGSGLTKTLITTYDIWNRQPVFLKSWKAEHRSVPMKNAARATSAAPTYFEPARISVGGETKYLVDGGVFINSPCVSAYVEALKIFPDERDFFVLSLGTGELVRRIEYEEAKGWGKAGWLLPVLSCMFDGVSDASDYQMKQLLGERYIRMQTKLWLASDDMDDATNGNLANLKIESESLIRNRKAQMDRICEFLTG